MEQGSERPRARVDRRGAMGLLAAAALTPPAARAAAAAAGADHAAAAATLADLLARNLVPFWRRVAGNPSGEGYDLHHDAAGRWLGPSDRCVISQTRTMWFFAYLARSGRGGPGDLGIAAHGFDFLTRRLWDARYGGVFWETAWADHRPTKADKHLNAQAHALFALSEYALAARSADARAWADRAAAVIDARLRDPATGTYREFLQRDWSPPPPDSVGYLGFPPRVRTHGTLIHLIEALLAHDELVRSPSSAARLRQVVALAERALARTPAYYFRPTEPPVGAPRVTYAKDAQTVCLLRRARARLGGAASAEPASYARVLADALRLGEDRRQGGLFLDGAPGRPADGLFKVAWVQAETLLALADAHARAGDAASGAAFGRVLDWVARRQADWANGAWFGYVTPTGRTGGPKADVWAAPYHNGRSLLDSLALLERRAAGTG